MARRKTMVKDMKGEGYWIGIHGVGLNYQTTRNIHGLTDYLGHLAYTRGA
jgi:hypothetical protein